MTDVIYSINGPVVTVRDTKSFEMAEMVYVGDKRLVGEVIGVTDRATTIQVYEVTTGLRVGEPVTGSGSPLSALLGPGIIGNIFDGIERPLGDIAAKTGAFIPAGVAADSLDFDKPWAVTMAVRVGDQVKGGDVFATCPETSIITHKSMVPPDVAGEVVFAAGDGPHTLRDVLCRVKLADGSERELTLAQRWPIRRARPAARRLISRPASGYY